VVGGGYIGLRGGFIKCYNHCWYNTAVITVIHKLKDVPFFGYPITLSLSPMVSPKSLCKEMQVGFWWGKLKTNLG
jgi:hypothetical protein